MITRQSILDAHPIDAYLEHTGRKLVPSGKGVTCLCPFHGDHTPSMSIDLKKQVWYCFVCGFGGTVIDLEMRMKGKNIKQAMHDLADAAHLIDATYDKTHVAATYHYKDQLGRTVQFIDRVETGMDKRFVQYTLDDQCQRVNKIDGVQRVLYRLERWAGKDEVDLVEGEKCVEALESTGVDATTNPGGSNGWLDSYALYLEGKHVNIWPDNDDPGKKWLEAVLKSLEGKVKSLRILKVPAPYNDVADVITAQGVEMGTETLTKILLDTPRIDKGVILPLLSSGEAYTLYKRQLRNMNSVGVDLGKWLPSLRQYTRKLLPGDMAVILGDTGVGKTSVLVNIAHLQRPLPVILFEIELSPEAMTERFISRDHQLESKTIEESTIDGKEYQTEGWNHIFICPKSNIGIAEMETIINRSELKIGRRPVLVLIDYIGLISGSGSKRYERMSTIAEGIKVMARATNTVIIVASQVSRDKDRQEIGLHDGKDSSSIECSAQLVLGTWRPMFNEMVVKILKCTKAKSQGFIQCNYDGDKQLITERTFHAEGQEHESD